MEDKQSELDKPEQKPTPETPAQMSPPDPIQESEQKPPEKPPVVAPPSEMSNKKSKKMLRLIIFFVILAVIVGGGYILYNTFTLNSYSPDSTEETSDQATEKENKITDSDSTKDQSLVPVEVSNLTLNFGKDWGVTVKEWTDDHSLFKIAGANDSQVEIEYFSKDKYEDFSDYLNPLLKVTQTTSENIGNNSVRVDEGKEEFAGSVREFSRGTVETDQGNLVLTVVGNGNTRAQFNTLANSLFAGSLLGSKSFSLVKDVHAEESSDLIMMPTYALPELDYKKIKIMKGPYEEEITSDDNSHRGGYAKGYKFFAFKDQRLVAVAYEDRDSNPNSFVESQLFSETGQELSGIMGTRIEFTATYTGDYYFVVNSFKQQEGKMWVGVDDREQTDVTTIVKYPDGKEVLKDPTISESIWLGNTEVAIIIEIPNPITVIESNTMEYESLPAFGYLRQEPHQVTSNITAYIYDGDDGIPKVYGSNFELAEAKGERIDIKLTQIGLNRVLVTPVDGLFPSSHQVSLQEASEGIIRFFTEDMPERGVTPTISQ